MATIFLDIYRNECEITKENSSGADYATLRNLTKRQYGIDFTVSDLFTVLIVFNSI